MDTIVLHRGCLKSKSTYVNGSENYTILMLNVISPFLVAQTHTHRDDMQ